jgi:hypothetical protein
MWELKDQGLLKTPFAINIFGTASQDVKKVKCYAHWFCFLLIQFSLSSRPVPLLHQRLTQSMLLGDAGVCFIIPAPGGMRHVALSIPTSHCGWDLIDTQMGREELQRWPVPQSSSCPSGPGRDGCQDCIWGLRFSSHGSCCLFPATSKPWLSVIVSPNFVLISYLCFFI